MFCKKLLTTAIQAAVVLNTMPEKDEFYKPDGEPRKCVKCHGTSFVQDPTIVIDMQPCEAWVKCEKCDHVAAYFAYGAYQ